MLFRSAVARDVRHPQESASDRPPGPGSVGPAGRDDSGLTAREREVARLVLEGKTHREIGEAMFVSPRTAEHHLAQIRRRLGVTTRAEMLERLRAVLATSPDP